MSHILLDPSPCHQCKRKKCREKECPDLIGWFKPRWRIACDLVRVRIRQEKEMVSSQG